MAEQTPSDPLLTQTLILELGHAPSKRIHNANVFPQGCPNTGFLLSVVLLTLCVCVCVCVCALRTAIPL